MHETDVGTFLPCCYGYATTIRRAQGLSLTLGCIYFDQYKYHAGRGYGYVAVSRFRTRGGCCLYGHKRRTDFLPVGGNEEDEVLERGYLSLTDSDSDSDPRGREYAANSDFSKLDFDALAKEKLEQAEKPPDEYS